MQYIILYYSRVFHSRRWFICEYHNWCDMENIMETIFLNIDVYCKVNISLYILHIIWKEYNPAAVYLKCTCIVYYYMLYSSQFNNISQ